MGVDRQMDGRRWGAFGCSTATRSAAFYTVRGRHRHHLAIDRAGRDGVLGRVDTLNGEGNH